MLTNAMNYYYQNRSGIDIEEKYIDSKGKLNLQQCGLAAYAHGEYFALGRKLGDLVFL